MGVVETIYIKENRYLTRIRPAPTSGPVKEIVAVRIDCWVKYTLCAVILMLSTGVGIAGALDDFLQNPLKVTHPTWPVKNPPHVQIPRYLSILGSPRSSDRDKGVAVGNLAWLALNLSEVPETRAAGKELLRNHVTPNLELAKVLEANNACSWRHSLLASQRSFLNLQDGDASEECLMVLYRHSDWPGDQEMTIYLLAYQMASQKKYHEAIEALQLLPEGSKWANQNPQLIKIWSKKQTALENQLKQQAVKNRIKMNKAGSGKPGR